MRNIIPNNVFVAAGGVKLLSSCPLWVVCEVPVKLTNVHKESLTCTLWNNMYVVHKNQTLFLQKWFLNNVNTVNSAMKAIGGKIWY